jgi:hypothetical protein
MQIDMPTTTTDRINACHCMSLPIASQNTQYYLQASYGLACAVASAEMALLWGRCLCGSFFSEASSLRFGPLEACLLRFDLLGASAFAVWSVGGTVFAVRSFRRRVFCGSILSEACLLQFSPLGALSLRFDFGNSVWQFT